MNVCHLTSVHSRTDTRIFLKECRSLAGAGHHVSLLVADGKGDGVNQGITIFDVGVSRGRLERMFSTCRRMFAQAEALDADVYHLHDPELIPAGLKLKRLGKKVIFDAHEDVPKQVLGKHYLNKPTKWLLSKLFAVYEARSCRHFDAIVTATPFIREKFLAVNSCTVDINNFPMLDELTPGSNDWSAKSNQVCYIGGIVAIRGIKEMVKAMEYVDHGARLQLGGTFRELTVERQVKKETGWARVDELGWLGRNDVRALLARSVAGLVTLHPVVNYLDSLPVKMFEYMAVGIPVIASDFPVWREILDQHDCGLCVDPLNPQEIAGAINSLLTDHERAAEMGANGRRAVEEVYNWQNEERKLLDLYQEMR